MAEDTATLSEKQQARFARERRGTGEGCEYVPGLTFREMRGVGRMHRFACSRCGGRQIVMPSDLMLATFLTEHARRTTCDLKDHFPVIDVEETVKIARSMGVSHPAFADKSPRILITGLLVCSSIGDRYEWKAIDTMSARPDGTQAGRGHAIIREYWRRRGISWQLARSNGLNDVRTRNLWHLFQLAEQMAAYGLDDQELVAQDALRQRLRARVYGTLLEACSAAAHASGLHKDNCVRAALQMIATGAIECALDVPVLIAQPVTALRFPLIRSLHLASRQAPPDRPDRSSPPKLRTREHPRSPLSGPWHRAPREH
jgi:hypothetical protein